MDAEEINRLEAEAGELQRRGRAGDALARWQRVLALDPRHARAAAQLGQAAFLAGDLAAAHGWLSQAAEQGTDPRGWINVALVCQRQGDAAGEEAALVRALALDPFDLLALVMRAKLYERQGRMHDAAAAYGAAATVAPPEPRLAPELRPAVSYARTYEQRYQQARGEFLDRFLEPVLKDCAGADLSRFQLALDILVRRKRRHDTQPLRFYYPRLEPVEFFDRADFPWLEAVEAGTDAVRTELLRVVAEDTGFAPYIQYGVDEPVEQWAELNHSPRWSAFHLVKDGLPVPGNAERCPQTMALWRAHAPAPDQPGRSPVALFSLLKPRTHIPPHTGASNVRLLTHLPLVIPPGCSFRVGNTVREWVPGRAWVFDDTIEHEARNDSDQLRVIMIFDVWHPRLTPEERRLVTALNAGLNAFGGVAGGYDA